MRRVVLSILACLALVIAPAVSARAEPEGVCVVVSKKIPPYLSAFAGVHEVLANHVRRFDLDGDRERGAKVVESIMRDGCREVIAIGSLALDVVRLQVHDRGIVYTMVSAPLDAVRAARNIMGVSIDPSPRLLIGMLKRMVPNVSSVGVVYDPSRSSTYVADLRAAAEAARMRLVAREAHDFRGLPAAVDYLMGQADAVVLVPDPATANDKAFEFLLLKTSRRGIPLVGLSAKHARDGALFAFDIDYQQAGRSAARMSRNGLWKASGAQESGGVHTLVVNMKAAGRLGLRIDPVLMQEAAEIIR